MSCLALRWSGWAEVVVQRCPAAMVVESYGDYGYENSGRRRSDLPTNQDRTEFPTIYDTPRKAHEPWLASGPNRKFNSGPNRKFYMIRVQNHASLVLVVV